MSAAEYGMEPSAVDARCDEELNMGPPMTVQSVSGSFFDAAKLTLSHFLRFRKMKTTMMPAMRRAPRTAPTTMPAMVPLLSEDDEPGDDDPPPVPSPESMGTTSSVAPWFQTQADTLKTLFS
jgi:hypothetical protein